MDNDIKELVTTMTDLVIKSEARVDRCNDIIGKSYILLDKITSEYTRQLTELQKARDELIKQNGELIQVVKDCKAQLDYKCQRYDVLLEKVFGLVNKNKSENNINVK